MMTIEYNINKDIQDCTIIRDNVFRNQRSIKKVFFYEKYSYTVFITV